MIANLEADIESTFKYFEDTPVLNNNDNDFILEGSLHCCIEGYEDLDDVFDVLVTIPLSFPLKLPTVIERGCKIPRTSDYHMNANGECCLGTKIALWDYVHRKQIKTFCQFLEEIIIIHFFQVKHFLVKGKWPQETEDHYTTGLIGSYKRTFNMTEGELKKVLYGKFKRYSKCLCKSKRFDKCHGKYISLEQIQKDFKEMRIHTNNKRRIN